MNTIRQRKLLLVAVAVAITFIRIACFGADGDKYPFYYKSVEINGVYVVHNTPSFLFFTL